MVTHADGYVLFRVGPPIGTDYDFGGVLVLLDLLCLDEFFLLGADALQEFRGGFVVRVLGNEFAANGEIEDLLLETLGNRAH